MTIIISIIAFLAIGIYIIRVGVDTMKSSKITTSSTENQYLSNNLTIEVKAAEFSFDPQTFNVPVNSSVTIKFKNQGTMKHNFVIKCSNFVYKTKTLNPGEEDYLNFITPPTYELCDYYCDIPNHKDWGMKGIMVVD